MNKYFLYSILLPLAVSPVVLTAQVNLQIEASRISGVAPLHVFFDATATTGLEARNDLVNADFSWQFDDNGAEEASRTRTKGMVAGHVFEAPGIYQVSCEVKAPDGATDVASIEIVVSPFAGVTYYVAEDGDDNNDGLSASNPWRTANHALAQLTGNQRLLFRRGDFFEGVEGRLHNISDGPIIIGAYGSGPKPILDVLQDGDWSEDILEFSNAQNIRVMDLHLRASSTVRSRCLTMFNDSEDILAYRLTMEHSSMHAITQLNSQNFGVFECEFRDFGVLALYSGNSNELSFVDNTIDSLIGTPQPEHGVRIQGGEKQFIAHNTLTNLIDTKTAITVRGDGQRHVMIYKNKMDRLLGINPQNAQTYADIAYVTVEGNYIGQNPDYNGSGWNNSTNGINVEATHVSVRNNVVDGYRQAIFVNHDYSGSPAGTVDVFHNTVNWRPVSPQSSTGGRIVGVRDVADVRVINNLLTAPPGSQSQSVAYLTYTNENENILDSNNWVSFGDEYDINPLPGSAADENDIVNYMISASSAANDEGVGGVPVFYDALGQPRSAVAPDIGAFEVGEVNESEEGSLIQFSAMEIENTQVNIHWSYDCESDVQEYVIERSKNQKNWQVHETVAAQGVCDLRDYDVVDSDPHLGLSAYRLKILKSDGEVDYSDPVKVFVVGQAGWDIYPNPVSDVVYIQFPEDGIDRPVHVRIFSETGKPLFYEKYVGASPLPVDVSHLDQGSYIIYVIRGKYKYYEVVQK